MPASADTLPNAIDKSGIVLSTRYPPSATYATRQTMRVTCDCSKLRPAAQLALEFKYPVILSAARYLGRQIIQHYPHSTFGNRLKRCRLQKRLQGIRSK